MFDGMPVEALLGRDVSRAGHDEALAVVTACERLSAQLAALQFAAMARMSQLAGAPDPDRDFSAEEIAVALHVSPDTARHRIFLARRLTETLPATRQALADGRIGFAHALAIAGETSSCPAEVATAVDTRIAGRLGRLAPGQLRRAVRAAIIAADPACAAERQDAAYADRRVELRPLPDGMSELVGLVNAAQATAIYRRLTRLAGDLPHTDPRTLDQRRADLLYELVSRADTPAGPQPAAATQPAATHPASADVKLIIDLPTLLGLAANPAHLPGYGPIDPALARTLAADGAWQRLVTDPQTGALLDLGRRRYRPSAALAAFIRSRDPHCAFPHCTRRAVDLDHIHPWHTGGTTTRANIVPLCRRHHNAKTRRHWRYRRHPDGSLTWTSRTSGQKITIPAPRPYD